MTGGIVVAIGKTGRNFGAGMSGGMAFVLDEDGDFPIRLNTEMVELEPFTDPEDQTLVRELLEQHRHYTGSAVANRILESWDEVKVEVPEGDAGGLPPRAPGAEEAEAGGRRGWYPGGGGVRTGGLLTADARRLPECCIQGRTPMPTGGQVRGCKWATANGGRRTHTHRRWPPG